LLRSRERGLAVSDTLGTRFSAYGDDLAFLASLSDPILAVAIGHPPRAAPDIAPLGPNCAGQIALADAGDGEPLLIQDGTMSAMMARLALLNALMRLKLGHALARLRDGPHAGRRARTHTFYLGAHDAGGGAIEIERDRPIVTWPGLADDPCYERGRTAWERLPKALDVTVAPNPLDSLLLGGKKVTVHLLGGCGMDLLQSDGVVADRGRVFDARAAGDGVHAGLYVCDGAMMPGSLGVTIRC
jgi:cholesterol oxidase